MSNDIDDSYQVGLRGGSIGSAKDALGWAVGNQARENQRRNIEASNNISEAGEAHYF